MRAKTRSAARAEREKKTNSSLTKQDSSSSMSGNGSSSGSDNMKDKGKNTAPFEFRPFDVGELDTCTLHRYKERYRLKIKGGIGSGRNELIQVVKKHFERQKLKEVDVITRFLYAVQNMDRELKLRPEEMD